MLPSPVPHEVTLLKLSNMRTTDSLSAAWDQPQGDLDSYEVLLLHDREPVYNLSVPANTTILQLPHLTAGAPYTLLISTVSGEQRSKQMEVNCHTGNYFFFFLNCVKNILTMNT